MLSCTICSFLCSSVKIKWTFSLLCRLNITYHVFLISICPYRSSAERFHQPGIPFTDCVGEIDVFPKLLFHFLCIAGVAFHLCLSGNPLLVDHVDSKVDFGLIEVKVDLDYNSNLCSGLL